MMLPIGRGPCSSNRHPRWLQGDSGVTFLFIPRSSFLFPRSAFSSPLSRFLISLHAEPWGGWVHITSTASRSSSCPSTRPEGPASHLWTKEDQGCTVMDQVVIRDACAWFCLYTMPPCNPNENDNADRYADQPCNPRYESLNITQIRPVCKPKAHRRAKDVPITINKPIQPCQLMNRLPETSPFLLALLVDVNGVAVDVFRPTAVMPFRLSTVLMADPWSKKSTRMNVGAFPYRVLHSFAASPKLPTGPDGAFVVVMFEMSGTSIPNACLVAKKWFIKGKRPD